MSAAQTAKTPSILCLPAQALQVLMLVTNSLKNDLNSRNQYTAGLALTALGNICSLGGVGQWEDLQTAVIDAAAELAGRWQERS